MRHATVDIPILRQLAGQGKSDAEISAIIGLPPSNVGYWRRMHGIAPGRRREDDTAQYKTKPKRWRADL